MKKTLFLGLFALFFVACSSEEKAAAMQEMPPLPVSVLEAKSGSIPIKLAYDGQTVSEFDVVIKPQVSGTIEEQYFKPGQKVAKGDKLYQIDKSRYQAIYDSANAAYLNAESDYNRALKLKATNSISQKEFDVAKATYEGAKASLQSAKIDLDYSEVKAPFDGVVGDTKQDVGAFVTAGASELVRLSKLDPIYVRFAIADTQKLDIDEKLNSKEWSQLNTIADMTLNGKEYSGTVVYIDNVINPNSASVEAKAAFANAKLDIRPGAYVKIKVSGFFQKNGFIVPQVAVLQDLSNPFVYVSKDGVIVKKIVKIVSEDAVNAVVSEGLENGDLIVLDNFKKIRVGSNVAPNLVDASKFHSFEEQIGEHNRSAK